MEIALLRPSISRSSCPASSFPFFGDDFRLSRSQQQ